MVTVATWNLENLYRPGTEFAPKIEADHQHKLNC